MQKFTVFKIAGEDFAIAIERVQEILKLQKVFSIPGLPEFLSGVMNVRNTVIPLMDLRRRFGKKPSGTKERIILVRVEQERLGLLVDSVHEILSLLPEEVINPPSIFKGFKTEYLKGLGKKDERVIILLNIDNILTAEEKIQLKESKGLLEESDAGNYQATQ